MAFTSPDGPTGPRPEHTFNGAHDLASPAYRDFLITRHGLERNEIVGRHFFNRSAFDTLEQALIAAHEHELALCGKAAPVAVFDSRTGTASVYATRAEARLGPD